MTVPIEAVAVLVRITCLAKEEIFELMAEWQPDVTDEELETFWRQRTTVN